jgi:hypothetical protein
MVQVYLVAAQNAAAPAQISVTTAALQFFRTIGASDAGGRAAVARAAVATHARFIGGRKRLNRADSKARSRRPG